MTRFSQEYQRAINDGGKLEFMQADGRKEEARVYELSTGEEARVCPKVPRERRVVVCRIYPVKQLQYMNSNTR